MTDHAIEEVLSGFVPIGNDHPAAEALRAHVAEQHAGEEVALFAPSVETTVVVRPGDVLLLTTDHHVTSEYVDRVKAEVFKRLPGLTDCVVLSGARVAGVYREEGP